MPSTDTPRYQNSDVICDPDTIYLVSGDGTHRVEVGRGEYPSWSPDGQQLAEGDSKTWI